MRVVQFTDLHLFADPEQELYDVVPEARVRAVWERIKHLTPATECLIMTGDLTHDDSAEAYRRISEMVNELAIPTYHVPGNHDDRTAMAQHLSGCIRADRCVDLGPWRLVLLDSQRTGDIAGELSQEQLRFLDQCLAERAESPALIALHHPPFLLGSKWIDDYRLQNEQQFWEVVDRHTNVRVVTCGHVHQEFDRRRNDVRLLTAPAAAMQFAEGTEEPEVDVQRAPGFRIFDLYEDGTLITEVARVRR